MTFREKEDIKVRLWDLNFPFLDQVQKNMGILIFTENNTCGLTVTKPFKAELEITLPKDEFEKSFFTNLKKATKNIDSVKGVKVNDIKINEYGETFGKKAAVIIEVYFDRSNLMLESKNSSKQRVKETLSIQHPLVDEISDKDFDYTDKGDCTLDDVTGNFICSADDNDRYYDSDDPEDQQDLNESFEKIYKKFN